MTSVFFCGAGVGRVTTLPVYMHSPKHLNVLAVALHVGRERIQRGLGSAFGSVGGLVGANVRVSVRG